MIAQVPAGSPRRELLSHAVAGWDARVRLQLGDAAAALEQNAGVLTRVRNIEIPATDGNTLETRHGYVRFCLITASTAAIRLGRYAEAEASARERLAVPPPLNSDADPQDEISRANVVLAHAMARQGRGGEALEIVQPVLDGYRAEQASGAGGTTFQRDLAYALYVAALAQPADAAGRARTAAALVEATRALDALAGEARQFTDVRDLEGWIRAARSAPGP
jgi:hypothetical protein